MKTWLLQRGDQHRFTASVETGRITDKFSVGAKTPLRDHQNVLYVKEQTCWFRGSLAVEGQAPLFGHTHQRARRTPPSLASGFSFPVPRGDDLA
jgi:hypothetical protein